MQMCAKHIVTNGNHSTNSLIRHKTGGKKKTFLFSYFQASGAPSPPPLPPHMNSTNRKMYMEESSSTTRNGVDSPSISALPDGFTTKANIRFDGGGAGTPASIFAARFALASPAGVAAVSPPLHSSSSGGSHKYVKELGVHDGNFPCQQQNSWKKTNESVVSWPPISFATAFLGSKNHCFATSSRHISNHVPFSPSAFSPLFVICMNLQQSF